MPLFKNHFEEVITYVAELTQSEAWELESKVLSWYQSQNVHWKHLEPTDLDALVLSILAEDNDLNAALPDAQQPNKN